MITDAIWLFYAGVLAQAFLLLVGQFKWTDIFKLLGCCVGSLFFLIPGKHKYDHLLFVACAFASFYSLCFKEKVLEQINKEIPMVWTLIGLYIAVQMPFLTSHPLLLALLLAPSLIAILNPFIGLDKTYGWKVYFYVWFLCVLVGGVASKFAFSTVWTIFGFDSHPTVEINPLATFVIGMSFLYIVVNLWYVLELIPLPDKHQSFGARMKEVRENMEILAGHYDSEQFRLWKTVLLFAASGSLLTMNYFYHFISDETLIPVLIVSVPVMDKIKWPSKTPIGTIHPTDQEIRGN